MLRIVALQFYQNIVDMLPFLFKIASKYRMLIEQGRLGTYIVLPGSSYSTIKFSRRNHYMTRDQATAEILKAKKEKGLTWEQIAKEVGGHPVWVTSVLLGQNSMDADQASKAAEILGLGKDIANSLAECPLKGSLDDDVIADPLIYRFHEITQVYGTTMKEIIHEMFGDGIMSAIDFSIDIGREKDPKGDRVVITYSGKFLPYKRW
jgi:cyanate lyase